MFGGLMEMLLAAHAQDAQHADPRPAFDPDLWFWMNGAKPPPPSDGVSAGSSLIADDSLSLQRAQQADPTRAATLLAQLLSRAQSISRRT
jgi:hypothetical protein